jgi:hypothetical protein
MKLVELFTNTPVPWKWYHITANDAEAIFMVGDIEYVFYSYRIESNIDIEEWELEFQVNNPELRYTRFDVTGTGNSAAVMSTIVDIMRDFLRKYPDVLMLTFSAKEFSRQSLYTKMVQRLLPTWKLGNSGKNFKLFHPSLAKSTS